MGANKEPMTGSDGKIVTVFSKLNVPIIYLAKLDMKEYCTPSCVAQAGTEYKLVGIVRHHGDRPDMGHYDCLQRLPDGMWLQRNDGDKPRTVNPRLAMDNLEAVSTLVYSRDSSG